MFRNSLLRLPSWVILVCAGLAAGSMPCFPQNPVTYMLVEGSSLVEDCTICGRPPIIVPMRGTFQLVFREENPLFTFYDVKNVSFEAGTGALMYTVIGEGTYQIGGEVALVQDMQLKVKVNEAETIELNTDPPYAALGRWWPMMDIQVFQQPGDPAAFQIIYSLHIIAAPVREIWFSTSTGFTSWTLGQTVSAGDLLSHTGRVVKKNSQFVRRLGVMPIVPDLGLDAFDLAPGGECLFSVEENVFSETLGNLQHGDLFSDKGRIVKRNQQLTSAFGGMPPVPDVGLDAVQMMEDGEILFSIEDKLFSENLGVTLSPGDLLSEKGVIVRTNEQLLANFEPVDSKTDVGLDAIHVWPSGEIWFSTEASFQSANLGHIGQGDLLSDGGWVIFRNLELLQQFAPLEDLADFGLDSLFFVTENHTKELTTAKPTMMVDQESGDVWLEWESDGKAFQVERADDPGGPYLPLGPISPGTDYCDPAAALGKAKSFYRLREW